MLHFTSTPQSTEQKNSTGDGVDVGRLHTTSNVKSGFSLEVQFKLSISGYGRMRPEKNSQEQKCVSNLALFVLLSSSIIHMTALLG